MAIRDCRLAIVMRIHRSKHSWLNALESDFVRRSISKRRRTFVSAFAFVALAFLALSLVTFDALNARDKAEKATIDALDHAGAANWNAGIVARDIRDDEWGAAHLFAASAKAFAAAGEAQKAAHSMSAKDHDVIGTFLHDGPVNGPVLSLVDFEKNIWRVLTWSDDRTARIWDPASRPPDLLKTLRHHEPFRGASFNDDSSLVLTWSEDGYARIWNTDSDDIQPLALLKHEEGVQGGGFSSLKSAKVLTWSGDGTAKLWDGCKRGRQKTPLRTFGHRAAVLGAMFNEDESNVLTWSKDGTACLWETHDGGSELPIRKFTHSSDNSGTVGRRCSRVSLWEVT